MSATALAVQPDQVDFVAMRLASARRVFPSDSELARALGVNRSQVLRWKQGQAPASETMDRLTALDTVVQLLTGYLSDSSIPKWLNGINAHLDDRSPLFLLRAGQLGQVVGAIEAMKSGAYA